VPLFHSITASARFLALMFATLVTTCSANAQDQPEVITQVDRQQVYLGESVIYNVTVNHVEDPSAPSLDGFDDFHVESVGQQSLNSQQITIINGRRSQIIRRGMLFQYRLTPRTAGAVTIPAPTATVDGEEITGRAIPISVVAAEEQDIVILEVSSDRTTVYPLQTFTVTLKLRVRELPGELSERSPLSVQEDQPVRLTAPWLDDENLLVGIEPLKSWREVLEPLAGGSSRGRFDGLQINDIGSQSAFSFFGGNRKAVFLPKSKTISRTLEDGTDFEYQEYTLQRSFHSQTPGDYTFAPCNIKGTFGTAFDGQSLDGTEIYAVSDSVAVTVKNVPVDGQPPTYIGGIGKFEISSDVTPRSAAVGDPITLSVAVQGEGTVKDLRAPDIAALNSVTEHFRVYESTEETVSNGKTFTWSLRPLKDDVSEFPAISMSYFDVETETYVLVVSSAVPLTITSAQQLAASEIQSNPTLQSSQVRNSVELNDAGLFANYTSLNLLRAFDARIGRWLPIWATMVVGFFVASFGLRRRQRLNADPSIQRKRNAATRAKTALTDAITSAGSESSVPPDALSRLVAGLIADFTNRTEAGLTSTDAAAVLSEIGVNDGLRDRVVSFMSTCDAARFGAGTAESSPLVADCRLLMRDLSGELIQRC
jgi:hypothetical protein